eukprot:65715_1
MSPSSPIVGVDPGASNSPLITSMGGGPSGRGGKTKQSTPERRGSHFGPKKSDLSKTADNPQKPAARTPLSDSPGQPNIVGQPLSKQPGRVPNQVG